MAYHIFTPWLLRVMNGQVNWPSTNIVAVGCMNNTTADTERDAATIADLTTLDEMDGLGYARHDIAGLASAADLTNDRAELTGTDGTYGPTVGQGTRPMAGILYIEDLLGADSANRLIAWNDQGFPKDPGGGALDQEFDPEGIFQIKTSP